ncbi:MULTISPECIES: LacI family DNA-binding transcriptional regulator [unclassified Rossellomorea]|uniref:LacI family DNA-binding transcriptional regulator n=1 Tax=unclassified Rossellomorea TaxID=2837526 RepID=UPI0020C65BBF|nr:MULTISPECIES: LacI family DNA-binding transcriptional regulator [unclassified Rossellomorea]UTE78263.1 LacI family transcriptional regulator [Rossellomorea sp. KS-H15a]WGG46223.1 LacI family DNA-binding transcriptional regulator [Rossellomorea sp. DA94]
MDIFDIAKLAGVSRKTVQRVLNDSPQVRTETRERILKIMEEHQYQPNVSARRLVKKKTHTIGLFIIQDPGKDRIYSDDLFYSVVIGAVINACSLRGYKVLVTMAEVDDPSPVLKLYREKSIDAGIIISWSNVQSIVDEILSANFLVGVFDQNNVTRRTPSIPMPVLENEVSAMEATRHLLQLGHEEIGIITGDQDNPAAVERLNGYQKAMKAAGISVKPEYIYTGRFVEESGKDAIHHWLRQGELPSAILCSNDHIAFGALKALKEAGRDVPGDVSLIGFDNILLTEYTSPALSTMNVPRVEMAVALVEELIHRVEGEPYETMSPFQASLVKRNSCSEKQA